VIGIVIVGHGGLAQEYLGVLEHVLGKLDGVRTIAMLPDDDRGRKQAEICDAADSVDRGDGVVIVADLWGASPCNLSLMACGPGERRILFGANLPLMIKLAKSRDRSLDDAVRLATEAGRRHIDSRIIPPEPLQNWGT
jgi:mannose PTS system EIIA component